MSDSSRTAEELLHNADTAMYHAKGSGKARFAVFDIRMRERAIARLEIETGLWKAIDAQELILDYQPELSAGTPLSGNFLLRSVCCPVFNRLHATGTSFIPLAAALRCSA
jgi:predicted signal transduction protein with EAL and GGDEF domain